MGAPAQRLGGEAGDGQDDDVTPVAAKATVLPAWAEELRRRYLRGEASVFVLYGNVHDRVLRDGELVPVSEFVAREVLEKKELIIQFNVSTGVRFIKKGGPIDGLEDLLVQRAPAKVLPVLEHLLFSRDNVGCSSLRRDGGPGRRRQLLVGAGPAGHGQPAALVMAPSWRRPTTS